MDENQYYSSSTKKYLVYRNPARSKIRNIRFHERRSLITALTLGFLLNRIVILPKFDCYGCQSDACKMSSSGCSLNSHILIKEFDKHFNKKYREHVFLKNHKVPIKIKHSVSPTIHVVKAASTVKKKSQDQEYLYILGKNQSCSAQNVNQWLGRGIFTEFSVLHFHTLDFDIDYRNQTWWRKIDEAFISSDYRQRINLG